MSRIGSEHWYVKENELSISLMRFYVKIKILKNDKTIYYQLFVKGPDEKELTFNFYMLEDAITFTMQIINRSQSTDEVLEKYISMFESKKFYSPYSKERDNETSIIELTQDEVEQAIVGYFGEGKNYRVSSTEEVSLLQNQINIRFYLIEYLEYEGIKKDIKTMLTKRDLETALKHYIDFYNYELIDFKYIGGIHRVGYYFDKDTPYYEGIQLKVKTKTYDKALSKSKNKG